MAVLKNIQTETYVKLRSPEARQKKLNKEKQEFLIIKMMQLQLNSITKLQFVKAMPFKFLPATVRLEHVTLDEHQKTKALALQTIFLTILVTSHILIFSNKFLHCLC